jgi:tetratricopeptide (TPR) repeat protein
LKGHYGIRRLFLGILLLGFWHVSCGTAFCSADEDLFEARLNRGLFNTDPYAHLLIEKARTETMHTKEYLFSAQKFSPDLPAVYFAFAEQGLPRTLHEAWERIDYFFQGIEAYSRNFWWLFNLEGLLFLSIITSCVLSLCVIVAMRFPMEYGLLSHDIREDRRKALLLAVPLFLSFFGFFLFAVGALFVFGLYFRPRERILVYCALLSLLLWPPLAKFAHPFLSPPSPELRGTVAVNEGRDNSYALLTLAGSKDFAPAFSYALAAKREGRYAEAISRYKALLGKQHDALVYTNMGNAYYAANDPDAAKEAYRQAISIEPRAAANYNLSQVLRATLDFPRGSEYFLAAARLDREAVSRFASVAGSNPNRFVADELLPMSDFWESAKKESSVPVSAYVIPFVSGLIMIPAFLFLSRRLREGSRRCKRCGEVFCSACAGSRTWGGMCARCYKFFVRVDELDSRERISRLMSLHQRQTRRRRTAKILSSVIPGTGQIYAGRLTAGLLLLWPFLFSLTVPVMSRYAFVGLSPFEQNWVMFVALVPALFSYLFSISHIRKGIQRGWL